MSSKGTKGSKVSYDVVKSESTKDFENSLTMKDNSLSSNTVEMRGVDLNTTNEGEHRLDIKLNENESNNSYVQTIKKLKKDRKYGKQWCLLFYKNDPLMTIGPDWCYFLVLTGLVFLSFYLMFIVFGNYLRFTYQMIGIGIYIFQFGCYIISVLANPGIPSSKHYDEVLARPELMNVKYNLCSVCGSLVNVENSTLTYHCNDCGVCIEGFDHHCPWTSKCIGQGNLKAFYLFVTTTFIYFIYFIIAIFGMRPQPNN